MRGFLRSVTAAAFGFLGIVLAAAEFGPFTISDAKGIVSISGQRFMLRHFDNTWSPIAQNDGRTVTADGFPRKTADTFEWQGRMPIRRGNGFFLLTEKVTAAGTESIDLEMRLRSRDGVETQSIALETEFRLPDALQYAITIDGKQAGFGKETDKARKSQLFFPKKSRRLTITLPDGILAVQGEFACNLQDNRRYGGKDWGLRIYFSEYSGMLKDVRLGVRLAWQPHKSTPLSLQRAANMGFADQEAEDRRGGWTDQGPNNDLRMFPVGRQTFRRIPFDIVNPAENGGKGCIVLRGPQRSWLPPAAELDGKGASGRYLYLLHGIAWEPARGTKVGTVVVESERAQYVNREVMSFDIVSGRDVADFWGPRSIENAMVGWNGRNLSAPLGLYLTRLDLGSAPVKRIRFESAGKCVWMIVGATLSDIRLETGDHQDIIVAPGKEYIPIHNRTRVIPGSILDFSDLLDAPAGKYGFVRRSGTQFEFERRPGIPVRFQGANACFRAACPPHHLADSIAGNFAAMGWNLLRLHHFDGMLSDPESSSPLAVHEQVFDRLDYLIAACKKRGIYLTLDLFTLRPPKKDEGIPGRTLTVNEFKALCLLDGGVRESYKAFARLLLNHTNPYTGLKWKQEPAIAMISQLNEDTVFHVVNSSGYVQERYEKEFERYLAKKRLKLTSDNHPRLRRKFLMEAYLRGYADLRRFCEEEGVRVPLTDQNFWGTLGVTLLRGEYDYADNHFYWQHPVFLDKKKPWQPPLWVTGECAIANYAGGAGEMAPTRLLDRPFSISEWNHVYPNPCLIEGGFLMGAYGALQDWSSICRFAWSHGGPNLDRAETPLNEFDIANDPMRQLSERVAVLFFRRRDVQQAKTFYPLLLSRRHADSDDLDTFPPALHRLMLLGTTGTLLTEPGKTPLLPAGTRLAVLLSGEPPSGDIPHHNAAGALKELELDRTRFVSDTGEIILDAKTKTFTVSTPKSEGFVLAARQMLEGGFAGVRNGDTFAGFLIAAMDGETLEKSNRYLLLHMTMNHNTGIHFRDPAMTIVEEWGGTPLLLRRNRAEITLKRNLTGFTLYAVELDGSRRAAVPFRVQDGRTAITADNAAGNTATVVYELVRE